MKAYELIELLREYPRDTEVADVIGVTAVDNRIITYRDGEVVPTAPAAPAAGEIDLADGVDGDEASLAGKALQQARPARKKARAH